MNFAFIFTQAFLKAFMVITKAFMNFECKNSQTPSPQTDLAFP